MQRSKGKILVVRGGAIGDFVLTLPVLSALRQQFADTQLELLGYPHIARLALAGGLIDQLQSIDARALASFFAQGGELNEELAAYFRGFNVVISFLYDPDRIFQTNVARCSNAQFIAGPHRPNDDSPVHATEVFLKPLERLAIFNADPVPRLHILDDADERRGNGEPKAARIVAVHPGSGSESKNWPESKWAQLLSRAAALEELGFLLIGGEAEGTRLARLAAPLPPHRLQIAQSLPLVEVAARLQRCILFVGHDSGISHLAAAVGLKGMILWGPSNRRIWSPRTDNFIFLEHPNGLHHLAVETVTERLEDLV